MCPSLLLVSSADYLKDEARKARGEGGAGEILGVSIAEMGPDWESAAVGRKVGSPDAQSKIYGDS